MIFTEREAAAKRCTPMQIIWLMPDREERQTMEAKGILETNCIGSRCAQWRWHDKPDDEGNSYFPKSAYTGQGLAKENGAYMRRAPARGFCGMAGRVE